jgi:restriction system protein
VISIGWRDLGDFSRMDEAALRAAIQDTYPEYAPQTATLSFNMLWSFYHAIQPGDIVIARRGRKRIAGVGTVKGSAYHSATKNRDATGTGREYPNHIDLTWHDTPRDKEFPNMVFGMQTLYEIKEQLFTELVQDPGARALEPPEEGVEDQAEFALEKYLEDFIVTNFEAIFRGELVLYQDPEENVIGQQYGTEAGTIDILAKEPVTNAIVVIELKKGRESDRVVGQTLRYMGWVAENLCTEGQPVKGIIVCRDADSRLTYALKMTSGISVKYYRVDFKLGDAPLSQGTPSRPTPRCS